MLCRHLVRHPAGLRPDRALRTVERLFAPADLPLAFQAQRFAGREDVLLADKLVERARAHAVRERRPLRVDWLLTARAGADPGPRTVQVGQRTDDKVQILSGIKAGEKVAVSGAYLIDSESQLRGGVPQTAPVPVKKKDALNMDDMKM